MPQRVTCWRCPKGRRVGAAPTPHCAAAGRCCWSWRSRACCCCCMATAQDSQVPHKTPLSPFTVQLTTAVLPELTYFWYSQCQSSSCWKIQVIVKEDPLGFRKFTITWFKREEFKTKEHQTGTQVVPQKMGHYKRDTPHFFSKVKKPPQPCVVKCLLKDRFRERNWGL